MSLINQMLQDLDARRAQAAGASPYGEQVRAVPHRRGVHAAWWLALVLAVVLAAVLGWLLLRPGVPPQDTAPRLPLKFDANVSAPTHPALPPAAAGAPPPPAVQAEQPTVSAAIASRPAATPIDVPPTAESERPVAPLRPKTDEVALVTPPDIALAAPASKPAAAAPAKRAPPPAPVTVDKQVKELTPTQQAENAYRSAILLLQQGKTAEAAAGLESVLQLNPLHAGARQALIGVLLEGKRRGDAMRVAREGLALDIKQPGLAMILAHLQLEQGALHPAIETLEQTLPYGADQADYQAFLAALLQRDGRHKQAVEHYLRALEKSPQNGVWWMGLGISLQADQRLAQAREAFGRAKSSGGLSAELLAFVDARLAQLQP